MSQGWDDNMLQENLRIRHVKLDEAVDEDCSLVVQTELLAAQPQGLDVLVLVERFLHLHPPVVTWH